MNRQEELDWLLATHTERKRAWRNDPIFDLWDDYYLLQSRSLHNFNSDFHDLLFNLALEDWASGRISEQEYRTLSRNYFQEYCDRRDQIEDKLHETYRRYERTRVFEEITFDFSSPQKNYVRKTNLASNPYGNDFVITTSPVEETPAPPINRLLIDDVVKPATSAPSHEHHPATRRTQLDEKLATLQNQLDLLKTEQALAVKNVPNPLKRIVETYYQPKIAYSKWKHDRYSEVSRIYTKLENQLNAFRDLTAAVKGIAAKVPAETNLRVPRLTDSEQDLPNEKINKPGISRPPISRDDAVIDVDFALDISPDLIPTTRPTTQPNRPIKSATKPVVVDFVFDRSLPLHRFN